MQISRGAAAFLSVSLLLALTACTGDDASEQAPVVVEEETSTTPESSDAESDPQTPSGPSTPPEPTVAETIATGLTSPWGLDFLPDDSALVAERDTGLVKRVTPDGAVRTVGEVEGVDTETSEGGLLGLAVGPDFGSEPFVYVYYTTGSDNRIARLPYRQGRLGAQQVVFEGIPRGDYHNGGRIAFGPDDMLYVTTGDATEGGNSPDPDSLAGKILRLTPEGRVPGDNPDPDSPVWTLGHRNPQGFAWDGDIMWAAELGQDTWDELNVIEPEQDYGWPDCEGRCEASGVVDPKVQWGTDEASPSGIAYAAGAVWMAALAGERLWRIATDGERVVGEPEAFFTGEYGRLRTVEPAPDGSLWLVTSNTDGRGEVRDGDDRILRLTLD